MDIDDIEFNKKSVYIPKLDILVVSDLHIGLENQARQHGLHLPMGEKEKIKNNIEKILDKHNPSNLILNGDILHEFGKLRHERILDLKKNITQRNIKPIFIEGNHDTILSKTVDTVDIYKKEDIVFHHGHFIPENLPNKSLYIIGHDHPKIEIEGKKETCFLYGPFKNKPNSKVLMLPAFNPLCRGVTVNKMKGKDIMSPFIKDLDKFQVIIKTTKETLKFPKLKKIRKML